MALSVNTNSGSDLGVQQLDATTRDWLQTQNRITTGLKINGPKDDAAIFAIAQALHGEAVGASAVKGALAAGESTVATALAAGQTVSDLLIEMKAKIVQANQSGLSGSSRNALQNDLVALRNSLASVVSTADFNGRNLIEQGATDLFVLSAEDGSTITVGAQDLSAAGLGVDSISLLTEGDAAIALGAIDIAIDSATSGLAQLGSASQLLEDQNDFTTQLHDNLKAGIGNLVDADLGEEAANLAASQVKGQLGIRTLAIANAGPRSILSLFP